MSLPDLLGRPVRDLRLSVTDRCNFRCPYCMPRAQFGADHAFAPRSDLLTFEELARLVRVFAGLGVTKVRLTGGEPLLRRDLETLVGLVVQTPGITDVGLTTNGSLLAERADTLRAAGLARITVSLDSVDPTSFAATSDSVVPLATVINGIDAAINTGMSPVKLNAVIRRGVNDDQLIDLVEFARERGVVLRFIEYMDVGATNGWRLDEVVPTAEILERVGTAYAIEPLPADPPSDVARRWRYVDCGGELGVISSVTQPFCTNCTRVRVTATGEMFTCLFAAHGRDLRSVLRSDASDAEIADVIQGVWSRRDDRYSDLRGIATTESHAEMSYLGG
jgi:cyclic pyranopterin phosphate synthase